MLEVSTDSEDDGVERQDGGEELRPGRWDNQFSGARRCLMHPDGQTLQTHQLTSLLL